MYMYSSEDRDAPMIAAHFLARFGYLDHSRLILHKGGAAAVRFVVVAMGRLRDPRQERCPLPAD